MKNLMFFLGLLSACSVDFRRAGAYDAGQNPLVEPDGNGNYWPNVKDSEICPDMGADLGTDLGADIGADLGVDLGPDSCSGLGRDLGADLGYDLGTDLGADLSPVCGENLVDNGGCEAGGAVPNGWTLLVTGAGGAEYMRDCESAREGECACRVNITSRGDDDAVRLESSEINVPRGAYEFCASARAAMPTTLRADGPMEPLAIEAGGDWNDFCAEIEISREIRMPLRFWIQARSAPINVWIDAVSFRQCI